MTAPRCFIVLLFAFALFSTVVNALSSNYYDQTCPNAQLTITKVVKKAMLNDKTVPAALLRMHFHDCFVRGCDGSVLLNSTRKNKAEKDGPPNISLHAFYVIDVIKKQIEDLCPGVVSCADIVALAARDAVALKRWKNIQSHRNATITFPTFNMSQLHQNFARRGLSLDDLVALSGGHTLGFSHCSSFQNRIHKFDNTHNVDPTLQASFATSLQNVCPMHNKIRNAGATMDSTTTLFDNTYYKLLMNGKGLFSSDEALLTNSRTKRLVSKYASSQDDFFKAFANSMIRMSSINGNGQEVRLDCKFVR
ncbi:unnamed protein product [Withania somnifera]